MIRIATAVLCALVLVRMGVKAEPEVGGQAQAAAAAPAGRGGEDKPPKLPEPREVDSKTYMEEIDMSKPVVGGSCYPHRDNGDGTCTVEIYTRQPGVRCTWVAPRVGRTVQLECVYPKPKDSQTKDSQIQNSQPKDRPATKAVPGATGGGATKTQSSLRRAGAADAGEKAPSPKP